MLHPLQRCISSLINSFIYFPKIGHYLMGSFYLSVLLYAFFIILFNKFSKKRLIYFIVGVLFWIFAYIFSVDTREYFNSSEVKIICTFYMPLSIFVVSNVKNWKDLFRNKFYVFGADFLILFSFLSKVVNPERSDYMSYSYNLLPFWCLVLIAALHNKKRLQWIFVFLGFVQGIFYGSRGAILWLVMCGVLVSCLQFFHKNGLKKLIKSFIGLGVITLVGKLVFPILMETSIVSKSYILRRIQSGNLSSSSGRDILFEECLNILANMNFNIYGLFYDRTVLSNGWYSHNLIFEVFISFGWLLGFIFLFVLFLYLILICFNQNKERKIVFIFLSCSLFFRYFLSGSIFDEGNFWIFLGAIASLKNFRIKLGR